eukprot:m.9409 g.9409  ORF g.9409 m.9409 type:complete len:841 (-) comp3450_c0_seq1:222-2744(-)
MDFVDRDDASVVTIKPFETIMAHGSPILSVDFSLDGKFVVSCSKDKTAKVFSTESFEIVHTLQGHRDRVNSVCFSSNTKHPYTLATASKDKSIRLWNADTGEVIRMFRGHAGEVLCVAFSPDGKQLASGSADENIILWAVSSGEVVAKLESHAAPVTGCSYSRMGRPLLASSSEDFTVKIWNTRTNGVLKTLKGHEDVVVDVKFSPLDDKMVLSSSRDKSIIGWNIVTATRKFTISGLPDVVMELAFSPDGWLFACACADTSVGIWTVDDASHFTSLQSHKSSVSSCSFSKSGKLLVSGGFDGNLKLWNVAEIPSSGRKPDGSLPLEPTLTTPRKKPLKKQQTEPAFTNRMKNPMRKQRTLPSIGGRKTQPALQRKGEEVEDEKKENVEDDGGGKEVVSFSRAYIEYGDATIPSTSKRESRHSSSRESRHSASSSTSSSRVMSRQPSIQNIGLAESATEKSPSPSTSATENAMLKDEIERTKDVLVKEHVEMIAVKESLEVERLDMEQVQKQLQKMTTSFTAEKLFHKSQVDELQQRISLLEDAQREASELTEAVDLILDEDAYLIQNQISEGSCCHVFKGIWEGADIVLKIFKEKIKSNFYEEIWKQEIKPLSRLNHPNIIQYYGATMIHGHAPVLAFELLYGSLYDLIVSDEKLHCREAVDIVLGIVAAVKFIHAKSTVHQRLGTSKILLTADLTPKLTGLCESIVVKRTFSHVPGDVKAVTTQTDSMFEKLVRKDVFDVGVIALEASTSIPFQQSSLSSQILSIQWEPMQAFVQKCTNPNPNDRPHSNSLASDLHSHAMFVAHCVLCFTFITFNIFFPFIVKLSTYHLIFSSPKLHS